MNNKNAKPFFHGKECFSRMNFLYQASMLMAGQNNTLSAYYGRLCRNIGKKAVLRIDPNVKRDLCKRCSLGQKPGLTADLSITGSRKSRKRRRKARQAESCKNIDEYASVRLKCHKCGHQRHLNVNTNYKFWLEQPESIAEVITLKDETKSAVKSVQYESAKQEK